MLKRSIATTTAALALAGLTLAGCTRDEERIVGTTLFGAVAGKALGGSDDAMAVGATLGAMTGMAMSAQNEKNASNSSASSAPAATPSAATAPSQPPNQPIMNGTLAEHHHIHDHTTDYGSHHNADGHHHHDHTH